MILRLSRQRFICPSCRLSLSKQSRRPISNSTTSGTSNAIKDDPYLPKTPVRTRFAPSPTGNLHLGSLRTALFNYLLAKRTGGQFLLRIEDTDAKRTVPGAEKRIYEDLKWAGLEWDEGPEVGGPYGPYRQSERLDLYKSHATQLLETGHAYRCFCTNPTHKPRSTSPEASKAIGLYDRHCYHLPKEQSDERAQQGQPFVIRLKQPDKSINLVDLTMGKVADRKTSYGKSHGLFDDAIIMKSDGFPTYHLANVIDDHYMKITHVIRGVEWLISTRKHIALYNAFGWDPPAFAHVGLLLDTAGNKLSKRDKAFDLSQMQRDGVLPEALNNFLSLLGWSHASKSDMKSMRDLVSEFNLKFTKSNPTVGMAKLPFLSPKHAVLRVEAGGQKYEEMLNLVLSQVQTLTRKHEGNLLPAITEDESSKRNYVSDVLKLSAKNYTTAAEFSKIRAGREDALALRNTITPEKLKPQLLSLLSSLSESEWTEDAISAAMTQLTEMVSKDERWQQAAKEGLESGRSSPNAERTAKNWIWECVRGWICWGGRGPSMVHAMIVLGRGVVLERIRDVELVMVTGEGGEGVVGEKSEGEWSKGGEGIVREGGGTSPGSVVN